MVNKKSRRTLLSPAGPNAFSGRYPCTDAQGLNSLQSAVKGMQACLSCLAFWRLCRLLRLDLLDRSGSSNGFRFHYKFCQVLTGFRHCGCGGNDPGTL
jgi:hypothetical protein